MVLDRNELLGPLAAVAALVVFAAVPGDERTQGVVGVPEDILEFASPGGAVAWPQEDGFAAVMPLDIFKGSADAWCRSYRVVAQDRETTVEATACRHRSGLWMPHQPEVAAGG